MLIYLTAESCTACKKMARTTFRDESVLAALRGFHAVKVDCTDSRDPEIADLMTRLGARGFPFFAISKAAAPALPRRHRPRALARSHPWRRLGGLRASPRGPHEMVAAETARNCQPRMAECANGCAIRSGDAS